MIELHNEYPNKCIVAVEEVPLEETHKYGVISGDKVEDNLYLVTNMIEKPQRD